MQVGQFASFTLRVAGAVVGMVDAVAGGVVACDDVAAEVLADADVSVAAAEAEDGGRTEAELDADVTPGVRLTGGAVAAALLEGLTAPADGAASDARPGTVTTTVAPAGAATASADGDAAAVDELSPEVEVATVHPDNANNTAPATAEAILDGARRVRNANMTRSYTTTPVRPGTSRPSPRPSRMAGAAGS